jgi:hypothetical protein
MIQRQFNRIGSPLRQENPGRRYIRLHPFPIAFRKRKRNQPSSLFFVIVIALVAALFSTQTSSADQGLLRGPGKAVHVKTDAKGPAAGTQGILEEVTAAPVLFYQRFLSRHWGRRCGYYPSCSNYALLAIRKHGAIIGSVITFDRLQHEADEPRTSPPILTGGQIKVYDPLENNDYWWYIRPGSEWIAPTDKGK